MTLQPGQRVNTPHGYGVVRDVEHYSRIEGGTCRVGVELDLSPFYYRTAYYWPKEITKAELK